MASQRRAPTKRPPRPVAKKPPPPGPSEGTDAAEGAKGTPSSTTPTRSSKTVTPGTATKGTPAKGTAKGAVAKGTDDVAAPGTAKAASPTATKAGAPTSAKNGSTTAKSAPPGSRPKTSPSGPNYRPPTGAPRSAARRPPPPPKRRKMPRITKKTIGAIVALTVIAAVVVFFSFAINGSSSPGSTNVAASDDIPENVPVPVGPVLAAPNSAQYGQPIDGIQCQTSEQVAYHIHAHLTIFVNGKAQQIPYGIGIAQPLQTTQINGGTFVEGGGCFYWLHTHSSDGIIHIESPTTKTYTLGQFFDEWGQPLSRAQVGPALGKVTVYQNGKPYTGDPRAIQLTAHNQIQLDVGSPAPKQTLITFPSGL